MQLEQAPASMPYEKPEGGRRGLVIVETSDGKGKSTAASGLALRAQGRGKAVRIFRSMKLPELAGTVTEMVKIKHAFNAGVPAQRGIED